MNLTTNSQNDTIESYMREYIDSPSSMNQRKHNIEIVDKIVEKLRQINLYTNSDPDFSDLKPSSQALKNNILEEVSIRIMTDKETTYAGRPRKYISSLLAIGAKITDEAEQNLFDFYTQRHLRAKKREREFNIERANAVRGFLKPGRTLPEIEQKLDDLDKKTDKLQQQITDLQKQANSINNKATRIENNQSQCCVIL